jgi:rhodanese-related sulfurtransferase
MMEFEITPQEAKAELEAGAQLLDVREPWEVGVASIGGLNIPMGDIPSRIQELDPDEHIIVLCHLGVRSLNVTAWLRQQGYERAQSIRGGIDRWSREVDASVPHY